MNADRRPLTGLRVRTSFLRELPAKRAYSAFGGRGTAFGRKSNLCVFQAFRSAPDFVTPRRRPGRPGFVAAAAAAALVVVAAAAALVLLAASPPRVDGGRPHPAGVLVVPAAMQAEFFVPRIPDVVSSEATSATKETEQSAATP